MNKQSVIILNIPVLFNILNEIKDVLILIYMNLKNLDRFREN